MTRARLLLFALLTLAGGINAFAQAPERKVRHSPSKNEQPV